MKFNVTISTPSPLIALGSLIFNGSSIWLNSVWETNDVPYTVYLDSAPFSSVRQPTNDLLYYAANLDPLGRHTVVVQPATLLESIIIEMDLSEGTDTMMSLDDNQLFEQPGFSAAGEWIPGACLVAGRTICYTSFGTGSSFSYPFDGDAITLWGAVENNYTRYEVSMDGAPVISYSPSNANSSQSITVLAHYSNLGLGPHNLMLTSVPEDGKSRLEIDYAQVYTDSDFASPGAPGTTDSPSTSSPGSSTSLSTSSSLSGPAKIASIVGTIVGVLIISSIIFFLYKIQQQKKQAAAAAHARRSATIAEAVAGIRMSRASQRPRDSDEETLASSKWSVKEGLELSVIESQTERK